MSLVNFFCLKINIIYTLMVYFFVICHFRKNMQRNRQMTMGRKKFNMDPAKVNEFI